MDNETKPKRVHKPKAEEAAKPSHNLKPNHWLSQVLATVPSRKALATHLGMKTEQGVYAVLMRVSAGGPVKAEYVPALASLANVPPHKLRPDLYTKEMVFKPYAINEMGAKVKYKAPKAAPAQAPAAAAPAQAAPAQAAPAAA